MLGQGKKGSEETSPKNGRYCHTLMDVIRLNDDVGVSELTVSLIALHL